MKTSNDNKQTNTFNFDEWMKLAQENPLAFEEKRKHAIEGIIENASSHSKKRLLGLQWQIDSVRENSKSSMAACMKISKMMWKNVQGEDGLLDQLNLLTGKTSFKEKEVKTATIVKLQCHELKSTKKTGLSH